MGPKDMHRATVKLLGGGQRSRAVESIARERRRKTDQRSRMHARRRLSRVEMTIWMALSRAWCAERARIASSERGCSEACAHQLDQS